MKKLRLILFDECARDCPGCCNKDWKLPVPECKDFAGYEMVLLTGGEPMLRPNFVVKTIRAIRSQAPSAKVYMYTAKVNNIPDVLWVLSLLDGMCVTLHEPDDIGPFDTLNSILLSRPSYVKDKSMRLNVFRGVDISGIDVSAWQVKKDIEWVKNAPLPEGETLMRLQRGLV